MKIFFTLMGFLLVAQSSIAAQIVFVSGRSSDNSYCSANSGYFCLENSKRRAEADAERNARWTCEMSHRGVALTYTVSRYTSCAPNFLPMEHESTWVNCQAEASMQCELNH